MEFSLHPDVYATNPSLGGLRRMLEQTWIRSHTLGDGVLYLVSGFANYNGGNDPEADGGLHQNGVQRGRHHWRGGWSARAR